jgi:N4-gp56 family major capsid protein
MADFTLNLSGTAEVDDSIREEYDTEFRLAFAEEGVVSQFSTLKRDIGAKSISLPKYEQLQLATTALNEREDVTSEAMQDSAVVITPVEYGNVVTTTLLANLQTGGMADRAAARLVGINAGRTRNKLAILALDAGTQIIRVGGGAADNEIAVTDTMDGATMGLGYNKLARQNVPGLQGGDYFMVAHDDVIHDIREQSGANSWIDAHKYALPEALLRNEVGMYKGFRVIRDNFSTIIADAGDGAGGAGTIDVYNSYCLGFNALGEAVSKDISMVATGPFDKLARFVNMGWHGTFKYEIIEDQALVILKSASSVGNNS